MGVPLKADRRLYLTRDGARVVEEGDPAAAFLFAGVGGTIMPDAADHFGLTVAKGKVVLPKVKAPPRGSA